MIINNNNNKQKNPHKNIDLMFIDITLQLEAKFYPTI